MKGLLKTNSINYNKTLNQVYGIHKSLLCRYGKGLKSELL
jgi:hypothetical protein